MEDKTIDPEELRIQRLTDNALKMLNNNKSFDDSFRLGAAVSFAYIIFSFFFIIKKITSIMGANLFSYSLSENIKTPFTKSGWLFMLILSIIVMIMNARANKLHHKPSVKVLYAAYIIEFIIGILGLASFWHDMEPAVGGLIMAVSVIGFRYADVTNRALKVLDELSAQEGFPDFNLNMLHSRLKYEKLMDRYGEDYNKRSYNSTYFSEKEYSSQILTSENNDDTENMSEISAVDSDNETSLTSETSGGNIEGTMDTISDKIILSVDDDYYEDYEKMRRRPL